MRSFFRLLTISLALLVPQASYASTISWDATVTAGFGDRPEIFFYGGGLEAEGTLQSVSQVGIGFNYLYHYEFTGQFEMVLYWADQDQGFNDQGSFAGNFTLSFTLCEDELAESQGGECDFMGSLGPGSFELLGQFDLNLAEALYGVGCCGGDLGGFASASFVMLGWNGNPWSPGRDGIAFSPFGLYGFGQFFGIYNPGFFVVGPAVPEPPLAWLLVPSLLIAIRNYRRARP